MTARADGAKRAAERWGRVAELLAVLRLACAGYRPIARRFRHRGGEIDLVVARGTLVAFVEVKARPSFVEAAEAIAPAQWRRVASAADAFMASRPRLAAKDMRFDAVLVVPWRWPRHVVDAWRPEPR